MLPSELRPASEIVNPEHCDLCHVDTPDVYADGCCCCWVHAEHGGSFTDEITPRDEED